MKQRCGGEVTNVLHVCCRQGREFWVEMATGELGMRESSNDNGDSDPQEWVGWGRQRGWTTPPGRDLGDVSRSPF